MAMPSAFIESTTKIFPLIILGQAYQTHVLPCSVLVGVCFHVLVSRPQVEFERTMRSFLGVSSILTGSGFIVPLFNEDLGLIARTTRLLVPWMGFFLGLFLSLTVYRLFFHRCRVFPGPLPARFTRFYVAYLNAQKQQYYQKLASIHAEYGDYVRLGPREISILDPAVIPIIYGPKSACTKSTFYTVQGGHDDVVSINGIRDTAKYKARRRAWDRGLSMKAMSSYQPRIKKQVDELMKQLRSRAGHPVDATLWSMFLSFDVLGDIGFSKDFGNMSTGKEHPALQQLHGFLWTIGVVQAVPWLPSLLSSVPGATRGVSSFFDLCNSVLTDKQKTFNVHDEPEDILGWLLKAIQEKDASAPPTAQALEDDNRGAIIAGSDTTANTLANALFYLAKHQEVQSKLRSQLSDCESNDYSAWEYARVKTISFLDNIIDETLRLKPPVIQGLPRETPAQGLHLGDVHIPGHVVVSVPTILIQRDPRWWQQPNDFIPERWGEQKKQMGTGDSPWIPFQLGMHTCAGKSLAYLTLRTAISALVQNFDIDFAPGETGEKFDEEFLASLMMALRPIMLTFTPVAQKSK